MCTSTTYWIAELRAGNRAAAQELWERYFTRLVALARQKLVGVSTACSDEEDVALSVFDSFFRAAEQDRFPQLRGGDDLWRLLVVITACKASNLRKYAGRGKRSVSRVDAIDTSLPMREELDQIIGSEPTPDFVVQTIESCRRLLNALDDDKLRAIAMWRLEGYTNEEIAGKSRCSVSTVERKLARIRRQWQSEI